MATRSDAQKIGSLGHNLAKVAIERSGIWIAREQNEDFGIDLEMELTYPEVSGKIIKVQVKSHAVVKSGNDFIEQRLTKNFLRYAFECRIPILLLVVCTSTGRIWYTWIQKWLYDTNNRTNIYNKASADSIAVKIHNKSLLGDHLRGDIALIASGDNDTHKLITLYELANVSLRLYDDALSEVLFSYLNKLKTDNAINLPDAIIDRVVEIGSAIRGTFEGNKRAEQLYAFIRNNGSLLSAEHIGKLVLRGDSYSRTGITGLSILYEEFPQHALSLQLPAMFKPLNKQVFYYCQLREKNIQATGFLWMMEVKDFRVGDWTIESKDFHNDIMDKVANRGDSAILDYLEYKPL